MGDEVGFEFDGIPRKPAHITEAWIEQYTGLKPIPGTVKINDNIQAGLGFLSNLCRVSFKTGQDEIETEKYILVKLLTDDPDFRRVTIKDKLDQKEIQFVTQVKPALLEILPELERNMCHYYGGKFVETDNPSEYASMLIMEDLRPLGYTILDSESPDFEIYLEKVMVFLAKLHFAGVALERKRNQKIPEMFPFCIGENSKVKTLEDLAQSNSGNLQNLLKRFSCSEDIKKIYETLSENLETSIRRIWQKGSEYPCFIHGDTWQTNLMVSGINEPIKAIDWQLMGYWDPAFEIALTILTCLPKREMRKEVAERFARIYYRRFLEICEKHRMEDCVKRSEEEFIDFFNTWGVAFAYYWFMMSVDAFPNDEEKLYRAFKILQDEYKLSELLLQIV